MADRKCRFAERRMLFPVDWRSFVVCVVVAALLPVSGSRFAAGYDVVELRYRIDEELPVGSFVGDVASDANMTALYGGDRTVVERLRFRFMKQHQSPGFAVDLRSGVIRTAARIDREATCPGAVAGRGQDPETSACTVRLDVGVQPVEYFRIVRVVVEIEDINDNAPEFPVYVDAGGGVAAVSDGGSRRHQVTLDILESAPVGSSLPLPLAVDRDGPRFSRVEYQLFSVPVSSHDDFGLSSSSSNQVGHGFPFRLMHERRRSSSSSSDDDDEEDDDDVSAHRLQSADSELLRLQLTRRLDRESVAEYRMSVVASDAADAVSASSSSSSPPPTGSIDVIVRVGDANDNRPEFDRPLYDVAVAEDVPVGARLVRLAASDDDAPGGPNSAVTYALDPSTAAAYGHLFAVDPSSGQLSVVGRLDRDRGGPASYRLNVVARDAGAAPMTGSTIVRVNVTDVNDRAPEIIVDGLGSSSTSTKKYPDAETVRVTENARPGTPVAHVTVTDGDEGDSGRFNCSLVDDERDNDDHHFRLSRFDETEFQLVVNERAVVDREWRDEYRLAVVCSDFGLPVAMTSRQSIVVVVDDLNDNAPEFDRPLYRAELIENNYVGASVVQLTAVDRDAGPNARLEYRMVAGDPGSEHFRCDPSTGTIVASRSIDREEAVGLQTAASGGSVPGLAGSVGPITFRVLAVDSGVPPRTGSTLVSVVIQDVNDNRPTFVDVDGASAGGRGGGGSVDQFVRMTVIENQPAGTTVGSVRAEDPDAGLNGDVRYSIADDGPPRQTDAAGSGSSSASAAATDAATDFGEAFAIHPETGVVTTNRMLDAEAVGEYRLIVIAVDRGVPPLSSTIKVIVNVINVNDNAPRFIFPATDDDVTEIDVSPNCPSGHVFARLVADDPDRSLDDAASIDYFLSDDGRGPFTVDRKTGNVQVVSTSGSAATTNGSSAVDDRQRRHPLSGEADGRRFALTVTAVDAGGLAATARLDVVVNQSAIVDFRFAATPPPSSLDVDDPDNVAVLVTGSRRRSLVVGLHVTVVAAVVAVSAAATVGLLVAIIIVVVARRRKNRNRKYCVASSSSSSSSSDAARSSRGQQQYNCRTAAEEASARIRRQYGPPPAACREEGGGVGGSSLPMTSTSACAWYATPAEVGPGDGCGVGFRASTVDGGGGRARTKESGGSRGGNKCDDPNGGNHRHQGAAGNRNGSRRSPFGSPKFSAGVAPRHVTGGPFPYPPSGPIANSIADLRRPAACTGATTTTSTSSISSTTMPFICRRIDRPPTTTAPGPTTVLPTPPGPAASTPAAAVPSRGGCGGDDGSNTDSGRGPSEEDVAELPPSIGGGPMSVPTPTTTGSSSFRPEVRRYKGGCVVDDEVDDVDYALPERTDFVRRHYCEPVIVRRISGSSSPSGANPTSGGGGCGGFDSNKRVRFQTTAHPDHRAATMAATVGGRSGSSSSCCSRGNNGGIVLVGGGSLDGGNGRPSAPDWRRAADAMTSSSTLDRAAGNRRMRSTSDAAAVDLVRIQRGSKDDDDDDDGDDDDGGGTTTSGSYDPAELGREFDRVFFAHRHDTPI